VQWRGLDGSDGGAATAGDDDVVGLLLIGWIVLIGKFVMHVVIPGLFFVLELLVLAVALPITVLFRAVFRVPYVVEAVPYGYEWRALRWPILGLRRSRRLAVEMATAIRQGQVTVRQVPMGWSSS
jgi:hypothetical protein